MKKIVPLNTEYKFVFLEEREHDTHPVSEYFLKLSDLSINLMINLKWIRWGFFFLSSLSKELLKLDEYYLSTLIEDSIQKNLGLTKKEKHILLIDDYEMKNDDLETLLEEFYSMNIFNENTKIHMSLKINLDEFLVISQDLYPSLLKFEERGNL